MELISLSLSFIVTNGVTNGREFTLSQDCIRLFQSPIWDVQQALLNCIIDDSANVSDANLSSVIPENSFGGTFDVKIVRSSGEDRPLVIDLKSQVYNVMAIQRKNLNSLHFLSIENAVFKNALFYYNATANFSKPSRFSLFSAATNSQFTNIQIGGNIHLLSQQSAAFLTFALFGYVDNSNFFDDVQLFEIQLGLVLESQSCEQPDNLIEKALLIPQYPSHQIRQLSSNNALVNGCFTQHDGVFMELEGEIEGQMTCAYPKKYYELQVASKLICKNKTNQFCSKASNQSLDFATYPNQCRDASDLLISHKIFDCFGATCFEDLNAFCVGCQCSFCQNNQVIEVINGRVSCKERYTSTIQCAPNKIAAFFTCGDKCPNNYVQEGVGCVRTCSNGFALIDLKCVYCNGQFASGSACVSSCPTGTVQYQKSCLSTCPTYTIMKQSQSGVYSCEMCTLNQLSVVSVDDVLLKCIPSSNGCNGYFYINDTFCAEDCPIYTIKLELSDFAIQSMFNGNLPQRLRLEGKDNQICVLSCGDRFVLANQSCVPKMQDVIDLISPLSKLPLTLDVKGERVSFSCYNNEVLSVNDENFTVCLSSCPETAFNITRHCVQCGVDEVFDLKTKVCKKVSQCTLPQGDICGDGCSIYDTSSNCVESCDTVLVGSTCQDSSACPGGMVPIGQTCQCSQNFAWNGNLCTAIGGQDCEFAVDVGGLKICSQPERPPSGVCV